MFYSQKCLPLSSGESITLDVYVPDSVEEGGSPIRRPAVVICPGGGYRYRSKREAEPIALRFLSLGFNAFVAGYRVAPHRYPAPQQDLGRAVAHIRANAARYLTQPDRIAVLGFSAGGHVAAGLGVLWHREALWSKIGLTPQAVKPNAMVLCYPVITGGPYAHRSSFVHLTGTEDLEAHAACSLETLVTPACPPAFLWHTFQDASVPVQNSYLMAQALAKHHVLTEFHVFPYGGHGASLCNEITSGAEASFLLPECAVWPEMAARFLQSAM